MTALVEQSGSLRAAGHAYAKARGVPAKSGERAVSRWAAGRRATKPALLDVLRAVERDPRTPAERAAFVELLAERVAAGLDLWTGGPSRFPTGRPLLEVAQELELLDQDLLDRARFVDLQNARALERRAGRPQDEDAQDDDEPGADGQAMVVILPGRSA